MSKILTEENENYILTEAEDGKSGLDKISKTNFDLVLCDIKMPKMDGIEVLKKAKEKYGSIPFIMLTGHGNIETAVKAMKYGAYDFIPKPPDLNRLLTSVRNALERKDLVVENKKLKRKIADKYKIIGDSKEINKIHDIIEKVAPTDARVLIPKLYTF